MWHNTQIANPDDISDDIRWEDFVATYLKVDGEPQAG